MDVDPTHYIVQQRSRVLSVLAIILGIIKWRRCRRRRYRRLGIKYGPIVSRDLTRQTRLDELYNGTDRDCIHQLRMRKDVFWKLSTQLRDAGLLRDTIHVSVEEQLAMFLHTVGHNLRNCVIAFYFKRSGETVSQYFSEVLRALCHLSKDMINLRSVETHPKITNSPGRFHPYFEGCIGALDGTHIPAFVPENIVNRFRGWKSYPTQNVLATVDFDLQFTYILAGWEGSAYDSVVLKSALRRSNGIPMPEVHKMDTAKSSLNAKGKGRKKATRSNPRAKPITWPTAISEYLLDWYIEKKLTMPPKTSFKRLHHTACTSAVNSQYGTTYSVDQVHRHWRRHRDTWGLVAKYLNIESGAGWDDDQKLLKLSQSTLDSLSPNDHGILTKPIQFYDKLQELFSGSTADGSFMQDPSTAAEEDDDDADKLEMMNDMSNFYEADVPQGEDSDKLESDSDDCQEVAAIAATASQVSSSNVQSMKPNKKSFKRVGKSNTLPAVTKNDRANKSKSKYASHDDDVDVKITNSLEKIEQALVKPVQVAPPPDPNTPLWNMLKQIALPADDRLAVGAHLCKQEFQVLRGFLVSMGQDYFERWVYKYLSGGDADN